MKKAEDIINEINSLDKKERSKAINIIAKRFQKELFDSMIEKDIELLSEETIKDIRQAEKDFKEGKTISWEKALDELDL